MSYRDAVEAAQARIAGLEEALADERAHHQASGVGDDAAARIRALEAKLAAAKTRDDAKVAGLIDKLSDSRVKRLEVELERLQRERDAAQKIVRELQVKLDSSSESLSAERVKTLEEELAKLRHLLRRTSERAPPRDPMDSTAIAPVRLCVARVGASGHYRRVFAILFLAAGAAMAIVWGGRSTPLEHVMSLVMTVAATVLALLGTRRSDLAEIQDEGILRHTATGDVFLPWASVRRIEWASHNQALHVLWPHQRLAVRMSDPGFEEAVQRIVAIATERSLPAIHIPARFVRPTPPEPRLRVSPSQPPGSAGEDTVETDPHHTANDLEARR